MLFNKIINIIMTFTGLVHFASFFMRFRNYNYMCQFNYGYDFADLSVWSVIPEMRPSFFHDLGS